MSAPANSQVGAPLVSRRVPQFAGYVVVGGSWKIENLVKNNVAMDQDEAVFNRSWYAAGERASCEMYQKLTSPPVADLAPSLVIAEVASEFNTDPGSWEVIKADPTDFGAGKQLKFSVVLERYDAQDLTQTS